MGKFVIQPHGRLHEWIADERGYFAEEGLDYEFQADGFSSQSKLGVLKADDLPLEVRSGAFEDIQQGRACDVSSACHWAVNTAATQNAGKMWGQAYSMSPAAIFVAPDSDCAGPKDLADVPVAVSFHSGSHYATIQGLEPFLERSEIKLRFSGLPNDRVRLLMSGKVAAATLFGAQYYLLEQLGFRKLTDITFMMGSLVPLGVDEANVARYFRGLKKAQRDIDLRQEECKHHWVREMPEDLVDLVDVRRFGPGERLVFEPYTKEMYEMTQAWMAEWKLLELGNNLIAYEEAVDA